MFLICFISLIAVLITKSGSNIIGENRCDLSRRCMNDHLSVPVMRATALKCIKRSSCPTILDNNLPCGVNQTNKIYIHLKDIRIKQSKNGHWIQVMLSSYDDLSRQGNQSLIVKFSFDKDRACYEFLIPSSIFMHSKDILLPCFRTQILHRHILTFYLSVHQETGEIISIQGMAYLLSNVANGQWLGGSVIRPIYDFDDEFIFFSANATQDLKCSFDYSIAVHKSHQYHICNTTETPVYYWSSELNSSYHRLNVERSYFTPGQKYCVYTVFSESHQCGSLHRKAFSDMAFFQLPSLETDKFYTEIPDFDCENWNLTIDVKVIEKNVIATLFLWSEYALCFISYSVYLYQLKVPICDPDLGYPIPISFNFETGPKNKSAMKVFKNVTIGYYCILVSPFLNRTAKYDWSRDSGVFQVSEETAVGNNTEVNKKDKTPEFATKVIVAISFLLFFTAFSLWSLSNYIRRSKEGKNKEFPDEKEGREDVPLLAQVVDEVYLFYSPIDDSIRDEVLLLESFLVNKAHFNVFTLSNVLPEALDEIYRNITDLLKCKCSGYGSSCSSNKKFIIVISERVFFDIGADWVHAKERAFREVLHKFEIDREKKAFCHLFLVVFNESILIDDRFQRIAPDNIHGAYFVIPNDLVNLCMKLGPSSSRPMTREELQVCLEHHDIRNIGTNLQTYTTRCLPDET